jgi:uncharacterized protein (DUF1501 family)
MNRRQFNASLGSLVAFSGSLPNFLGRTAAQAPTSERPGGRDTVLVVIQLTGGNDGLNTVIPFRDPDYARLRPTLKQTNVHRIDDTIGLHDAMNGLHGLLADRALCVVQGVGYPNPSQSHFRSMDIWQAGSTDAVTSEGWIGKSLRHIPAAASFHLSGSNEPAPLALTGAPARVPSIATLGDFQLRQEAASADDRRRQRELLDAVSRGAVGASPLDFVRRTAVETYASSRRLHEVGQNYTPRAAYPQTPLGNHLKLAAQLIDAGLGARLFYVTLDGFDTHASEAGTHPNLLRNLSDSITALYRDLAARGHGERVLIMTFSEFGRRAAENGSGGTDHGSAAPMLLVGGRVKPGIVGAHPSLTRLEDGNLRHHTDFRQVYACILERWLGVPSRQVLGEAFTPVDVLRA